MLTYSLTTIATIVAAAMMQSKNGPFNLFPFTNNIDSSDSEKTENVKPANALPKEAEPNEAQEVDEKFIQTIVERVKNELPTFLEDLHKNVPTSIVSETLDTTYLSQLAKAQEFLNENPKADLSRVKCLFRAMFPEHYHHAIDKLKQHQDPQTIINILGGQNVVAPNAKTAHQDFKESKGC